MRVALTLALWLSAVAATAQPRHLTWAEALELASARSEVVLDAALVARLADQRRRQQRALMMPDATLQSSLVRNDVEIRIGDRAFVNRWDYTGRLQATVPLVRAETWALGRAAEAEQAAAEVTVVQGAGALRALAARAYVEAWAAQDLVDVAHAQHDLALQALAVIRTLHEAGFATDADVAQAELPVIDAHVAAVQAVGLRTQALRDLMEVLGEPARALPDLHLAGPPDTRLADGGPLTPALLRARDHLIEAAAQVSRAARLTFVPDVSLVGTVNLGRPSLRAPDGYFWTLALQLDWSLLDPTRRARSRAGALEEERGGLERRRLERELEHAVARARERQRVATESHALAAERVETATRVRALVALRFAAGDITVIEMVTADQSLFRARSEQVLAARERTLAFVDRLEAEGLLETPWTVDK